MIKGSMPVAAMTDIRGGAGVKVLFADVAMLITAVLWGSGFGATDWLLDFLSPLWLMSIRFGLGAAVMVLLFGGRVKTLSRRDLSLGASLGVLLSSTFVAHVFGLLMTSPGKQSFIAGSNVVMVPFLYALVYRRFPSCVAVLGASITTAGLLVMAFTPGMAFNLGDVMSVFLAIGIAFHVLAVGFLSRRMDPVALTVVQTVATAVILVIVALVFEPFPMLDLIPPRAWAGLIYVVLFVTVIPFTIQTVAQRYSPEIHAAILLSMESPFGYAIALATGREAMNGQIILGGLIILVGVLMAESETFLKRRIESSHAS